ncbi:MAG: hypothetical protein R2822_04110 [Spirosomataceae bacterium]
MNDLEKESIKDETQSRRISASTLLMWVLGIGIVLMIVAYIGGYITTGGPDEKHRLGAVDKNDTAIVTQSDTIIGK